MGSVISFFLATMSILLTIPVAAFLLEVISAIVLPQRYRVALANQGDCRRNVGVLVPAHNESTSMLPTLADLKAQMRTGDRLLVVADNCSDDTAAVASAAGAEVVVRSDPGRKGKGYALDWGLRHLAKDPPDTVVMFDADCRIAAHAVDRLVATCVTTCRPAQALYLALSSDESPIDTRVAEFAWRVKNWVRPLGLQALGFPCQLLGSGMAFPWSLISSINLASGTIVEDLKLGLDCARVGSPAVFCPSARVTSYLPFTVKGFESQRLRQEGGYMSAIFSLGPNLFFEAARRLDPRLLVLALDLAIPPLVLLGLLLIGMLVAEGMAALFVISHGAIFVSIINLAAFTIAVFISWLRYGRDILPVRSISLVFSYAIGKMPFYSKLLCRKSGGQWIRTDRSKT
jgi:cellulose synthase/poly-beta-1,6-N-acetylglucosamine synthase-like glycosyltransferase